MAASSPKKKADKYAPTAWGAEPLVDLEMPSGQLAQVRRPGVAGLIKAGLLDSLDTLTALVKTEHMDRVRTGKVTTPDAISSEDIAGLTKDKERLMAALDLMDKVVEYVVVQPTVLRPIQRDEDGKPTLMWKGKLNDDGSEKMEELPLPDEDRQAGVVYSDMVDPTDKVYIFQFVVGGVRDLEQFRAEFGEAMGALESL